MAQEQEKAKTAEAGAQETMRGARGFFVPAAGVRVGRGTHAPLFDARHSITRHVLPMPITRDHGEIFVPREKLADFGTFDRVTRVRIIIIL